MGNLVYKRGIFNRHLPSVVYHDMLSLLNTIDELKNRDILDNHETLERFYGKRTMSY